MQNAAHHPSSTDDQAERDQIWHSSNDALARLLAYHRISLNVAVETAWTIVHALDALNRQMAALCRQTCRFCPDPCCIVDTVWFDFRDLLLFHLTGTPIPPCQPATELNEPCPFLGGHGCRLDYCVRPWMCVHYICPSLQALIRKQGRVAERGLLEDLETVAALRHRMEAEVVRQIRRSGATA